MRLIDVIELESQTDSFITERFDLITKKQLKLSRKVLDETWSTQILNIFLLGNKRHVLPNPANKIRLRKFYNCLAHVMESELNQLLLDSIIDYSNFLTELCVSTCT